MRPVSSRISRRAATRGEASIEGFIEPEQAAQREGYRRAEGERLKTERRKVGDLGWGEVQRKEDTTLCSGKVVGVVVV